MEALKQTGRSIVMATALLDAVKALQIKDEVKSEDHVSIDDILTEPRPRKRLKIAPDALKKSLEETFLNPPTSFNSDWLNKLQQYVR